MQYRPSIEPATTRIKFSDVASALSYALDLVEGQPRGHAARSCLLGMRLAREIGLPEAESSALFYALLLKDLGCSSNASKMCYLFGADDRQVKCNVKTVDWSRTGPTLKYAMANVAPGASLFRKLRKLAGIAVAGQRGAKELVAVRCERGADIARSLHLPEATAQAILSLDEHWDGTGHPRGLAGEQIPLLARILGLAQTAEVFWQRDGAEGAYDVAAARSGTWFDPELVKAFLAISREDSVWGAMAAPDPAAEAARLEPAGLELVADDAALDRVCEGFARVIDAKSPWTYSHSAGVADVAAGIARTLGLPARTRGAIRRAALVHDIGKLGVSNMILDKPGKLDADELAQVRKHPGHTRQILARVRGLSELAELAASHHERLDGKGYHRGIGGADLGTEARILVVADMYEALTAKRPYRRDLSPTEVLAILEKDAGTAVCPAALEGLRAFVSESATPLTAAA
ncbi:MAG: HD-GYP domain-containing protein [Phycisphaerae bacterium]|nr:HD domain-containing phosphohydrolase [Tepidisphaeraceae bacterium]